MKWLILVLGIAANASASMLVKLAVMPPRRLPTFADAGTIFRNWPFWLGLGMYGATFLLYTAALARLPLSIAHPVLTSGAVAAVAIASAFIFKDSFQWTTVAGIVLVLVGVALITARSM